MKPSGKKKIVELSKFNAEEGLDRGASKFKEIIWYLLKIIFFLSAIPYPSKLKAFILKCFGAKVGLGLVIKPRVNIHFPWKLTIGNDVWIGEEVFILNFEPLTIGDNVCISQRAFICGGNHDFRDPAMSYKNGPIQLEDGCWVGAAAFVGPNVTVGTDTVIAALSLVTHDLDTNSIYKGNPAKKVGERWPHNPNKL